MYLRVDVCPYLHCLCIPLHICNIGHSEYLLCSTCNCLDRPPHIHSLVALSKYVSITLHSTTLMPAQTLPIDSYREVKLLIFCGHFENSKWPSHLDYFCVCHWMQSSKHGFKHQDHLCTHVGSDVIAYSMTVGGHFEKLRKRTLMGHGQLVCGLF